MTRETNILSSELIVLSKLINLQANHIFQANQPVKDKDKIN